MLSGLQVYQEILLNSYFCLSKPHTDYAALLYVKGETQQTAHKGVDVSLMHQISLTYMSVTCYFQHASA